jgi:hypothetical protein
MCLIRRVYPVLSFGNQLTIITLVCMLQDSLYLIPALYTSAYVKWLKVTSRSSCCWYWWKCWFFPQIWLHPWSSVYCVAITLILVFNIKDNIIWRSRSYINNNNCIWLFLTSLFSLIWFLYPWFHPNISKL